MTGGVHDFGYDRNATTRSAFLLSHSSNKEGESSKSSINVLEKRSLNLFEDHNKTIIVFIGNQHI